MYDPKDVSLTVSATAGGTGGTPLPRLTAASFEDGNTGDVTTYFLGSHTPAKRAGSPDQSLSLDGVLDWADAGQTMLRDARKSGDTVYVTETYPDGAKVEYEAKVTAAPHSMSADGDWVENAYTLSVISVTETAPTGG
jgi:hypothetical protein